MSGQSAREGIAAVKACLDKIETNQQIKSTGKNSGAETNQQLKKTNEKQPYYK
jgi:hypothetical protein